MRTTTNRDILIVFDGQCGFCQGWVRWLIRLDRNDRFMFVAQQSQLGHTLLALTSFLRENDRSPDSIVVFRRQHSTAYVRSDAILCIGEALASDRRRWRLLYKGFVLIPKTLRDALYMIIARHRNKLPPWNRTAPSVACTLPDERMRSKLITNASDGPDWLAQLVVNRNDRQDRKDGMNR